MMGFIYYFLLFLGIHTPYSTSSLALNYVIPDILVKTTEEILHGPGIFPENATDSVNINKTERGDYVVKTGQNFTIECHGAYPPALRVTRRTKVETEPNFIGLNISKVITNETSREFAAFYHVINPDYRYTGEYECFYPDTPTILNKVYVFVSSEKDLFAPTWSPFLFMAIYHYKKTELPCRVTHPSIKVKLINEAGYQEVSVGEGTGVTYDPRLGFILHYPNQFFEGQFVCVASAPWGAEQTEIMVLKYLRSASVPQPALVPTNIVVGLGADFEIQCKVYVDRGVAVFMNWSYSSNELDFFPVDAGRSDRVHYTNPLRVAQNTEYGFDIVYSNLTVLKATKNDEGSYLCKVQTHDGKQNNISTTVTVLENDYVFIRPENNTVYGVEESRLQIVVDYDGYPKPINISWWFNGKQLYNNDLAVITITPVKTAYTVRMLNRGMAGIYTVKARNTKETSKDIEVRVKYKPDVDVNTNKRGKYYKYNHDYTLTCTTNAFPAVGFGDIWWEFAPCAINKCPKLTSDMWKSLKDSNVSIIVEVESDMQHQLRLHATTTGAFRCIAKNEVGNTTSAMQIFKISEMEEGLFLDIPISRPIEGANISMVCYATLWEYVNIGIMMRKEGSDELLDVTLYNRTKASIVRSEFSLIMTLEIAGIQLMDSGNYVCLGIKPNNSGHVEPEMTPEQNLRVRKIVKPRPIGGSNEQDLRLSINEGIS